MADWQQSNVDQAKHKVYWRLTIVDGSISEIESGIHIVRFCAHLYGFYRKKFVGNWAINIPWFNPIHSLK